MPVRDEIFALQIAQLKHDELYHKDVVIMPLAERVKHMALHNAKYVGYFFEALDKGDDARIKAVLVDAFIITLATANTINQDLGAELESDADSLIALSKQLAATSGNQNAFLKKYAVSAGLLAKVCESWDHLENLKYREMMQQANLELFKIVVAEFAVRGAEISGSYFDRLAVVEKRYIFQPFFQKEK